MYSLVLVLDKEFLQSVSMNHPLFLTHCVSHSVGENSVHQVGLLSWRFLQGERRWEDRSRKGEWNKDGWRGGVIKRSEN